MKYRDPNKLPDEIAVCQVCDVHVPALSWKIHLAGRKHKAQSDMPGFDDEPVRYIRKYGPASFEVKQKKSMDLKIPGSILSRGFKFRLPRTDGTTAAKHFAPRCCSSGKELLQLLARKSSPPVSMLKSSEEANVFMQNSDIAVVGFWKNNNNFEEDCSLMQDVACDFPKCSFAVTKDEHAYKELQVNKDGIVLFRKLDEGQNEFRGVLSTEELKKFVKSNSLPLVVEFSRETSQEILDGQFNIVNFLFINKRSGDYEEKVELFRNVAKEFRESILFVTINTDEKANMVMMDLFGINEDIPTMRIMKLDGALVFKPQESFIRRDDIRNFIQSIIDGNVEGQQDFLSEEIPEDWDVEPVKIVVGKNFDEVVFEKEKFVLVFFYSPVCYKCSLLAPIYEKLGKMFKNNPEVVFAKMDATTNELGHTKIFSFPTIRLYLKNSNEAVEYSGKLTMKGITQFLETWLVGSAAYEEAMEIG